LIFSSYKLILYTIPKAKKLILELLLSIILKKTLKYKNKLLNWFLRIVYIVPPETKYSYFIKIKR